MDYCVVELKPIAAHKYAELSETDDEVEILEWVYAYTRPADCLTVVKVTDVGDHTKRYKKKESGKYNLCNVADVYLDYYTHLSYDDTAAMSVGFRQLVSARLAVKVAGIWKPDMIRIAEYRYKDALMEAMRLEYQSEDEEETERWDEI